MLTPLKEFGILSEEAGSLPDRLALRVKWELCKKYGLMIIIMYRQVVQPSTLTNCRDKRREDNLGYDYIYGQATEAQSNRYYCSTQGHRSGQLSTLLCQRTRISYFNWGEGGKVSRPSSRRIHWPTRVTVIPVVIGALRTMSKNEKAWYGRLGLPGILEVHSCQPSVVLIISCGKCWIVSLSNGKLRIPWKYTRLRFIVLADFATCLPWEVTWLRFHPISL